MWDRAEADWAFGEGKVALILIARGSCCPLLGKLYKRLLRKAANKNRDFTTGGTSSSEISLKLFTLCFQMLQSRRACRWSFRKREQSRDSYKFDAKGEPCLHGFLRLRFLVGWPGSTRYTALRSSTACPSPSQRFKHGSTGITIFPRKPLLPTSISLSAFRVFPVVMSINVYFSTSRILKDSEPFLSGFSGSWGLRL